MRTDKPTPAQRRRLEQIGRGEITRSGETWVYGVYFGGGAGLTYVMMWNLHEAGWITDELIPNHNPLRSRFKIVLTDAGRAVIDNIRPKGTT